MSETTALRPALTAMRLSRLGSMHQCRLSFMRQLTRRMAQENWSFARPVFDIDAKGVGRAVYTAQGPDHTYSLVAFAHDLPPEMRSDRVIATAWDATFTLFDGVPTTADLDRLEKNVPFQEAGRVTDRELSVSRANRSVRLWAHVMDALASGQQPDRDEVEKVGYLMRTTAVYGSGKLGAADREKTAHRADVQAPFQIEMLSVFLTRAFVRDLVEEMARAKGGAKAIRLDPAIASRLGIGNSTGLGLAPFIVNHPVLFNNWIEARETAIARVCALPTASADEIAQFKALFDCQKISFAGWHSEHPIQIEKLASLHGDLSKIDAYLSDPGLTGAAPWQALMDWASANLGEEAQEMLASLILEPYGHLVDDLGPTMADNTPEAFTIDGSISIGDTAAQIENSFGWAFDLDWDAKGNIARAWYVSEEKLEPRLGERFNEPIAEYEQPLAPARDATRAYQALKTWDADKPIAAFLLRHPEHRHTVRRAQIAARFPYSEIHDNTIAADMLPIDMLRVKLAFFGATHFDPRSDRWVRICMYQDTPYPEDLSPENADFWTYPTEVSS
ncbi:hypothetical protein RXV86_08300 [Alisedimentitalea sp. MJ-SS2]|uniref:hypothetical protein n=1 Tax=Aliisedimentitalea sp. MJ-SS2 TaxID=3049795 RepID=UPI0029125AB8|nr:hypothetical protein [Alisedimentitalea sp. MJ-SS2]MDU8927381.1 hypothetical protein [Alisedimentitalea sp. MJ-SS2]